MRKQERKTSEALRVLKAIRAIDRKLFKARGLLKTKLLNNKFELVLEYVYLRFGLRLN